MGAAVSKTSSEIILKAITDVVVESVQNSVNSGSQKINIEIKDTDGDVDIDGLDAKQTVSFTSKSVFDSLNSASVKNDVDNKISQLVKSAIEGLNLVQISTAISSVNNIIENCISLKNKSVTKCSSEISQDYQLVITNTKGNVRLSDIDIRQELDSFLDCISTLKNQNELRNKTDSELKSLTESAAKGLDPMWIAIILAALIGVPVVAGKEFLGPILAGAGAFCLISGDKIIPEDDNLKKSVKRLKYKTIPGATVIKLREIPENVSKYDNVDVYEFFQGKVNLYSHPDPESVFSMEDDLSDEDVVVESAAQNIIHIKIKGDRYGDHTATFGDTISDIATVDEFPDPVTKGVVYVKKINFSQTGQILMRQNNQAATINYDPVVIAIKKNKPGGGANMNLVGWILVALGGTVMFTNKKSE